MRHTLTFIAMLSVVAAMFGWLLLNVRIWEWATGFSALGLAGTMLTTVVIPGMIIALCLDFRSKGRRK